MLVDLKRLLNLEKVVLIEIPFSSSSSSLKGPFVSPSDEKDSVSGV